MGTVSVTCPTDSLNFLFKEGEGGQHSAEVSILASGTRCPEFKSWLMSFNKKYFESCCVNTQHTANKVGNEKLKRVDRIHLALVSGKLVLQKLQNFLFNK